MKRGVLAPLLLFLGLAASGQDTPFKIPVNEVCGVDTYHAPNSIPDCRAQDANNLLFDQGVAAQMREGFVSYLNFGISAPVRGSWSYRAADGTDWYVGLASGTVFGYNGTSTSTILSGLDFDNRMDCAGCLGKLYCTNRSTHVFSFDGSVVAYSTHAPHGSLIECWRNRLVVGDVSGSQSTVYLSGELANDDWTVATISTSPVTWRVGGVDDAGNQVKCLRAGFADFLFIGTPGKTYGLFGNDNRDFRLRQLFSDVGCLDDGTVQEHLGNLTWVSNQGVERFDRNVLLYPRVSEPIRNITDGLIASASSEFSWTQTSQADFAAGTHDLTSASISPGDVVLSTFSKVDTSTADFTAGTTSNTSVVGDKVYLSTSETNVANNSFETSDGGTGAANWTESGATRQSAACAAYDGTFFMQFNSAATNTLQVQVLDSSGTVLGTQSYGTNDGSYTACTWASKTITLSSYAGRWIKLKIKDSGGNYAISDVFLCSGNDATFRATKFGAGVSPRFFLVDYVIGGRSQIYSGTFTSQTFDAVFTTAAWTISGAEFTTNGHAISFQAQTSTNSVNWASLVSVSTAGGSFPPAGRYGRYVATISTGGTTNGTALPFIDQVSVAARSSTGTFISSTKDVSGNTGWGNFEVNQTENGGTFAYFVRSAATEGGLAAAAWVAQTPFTTISAAVNNWVQYKAFFTITDGTQEPFLHDTTLFWRTGAASPAMVSAVYRDRYHLFYTTNTAADAYNNLTAPLDRNMNWTFFSGINAASATRYKNMLLFGDATGTGKVFRLYSGYDDNGSAISVRLGLKDFDASDEDALKDFDKLYITAGHETESGQDVDVDLSYTVDGSTDTYSLGSFNLGENVGRINARAPFPLDQGVLLHGKWISPKLSGSILDSPFSLYGIRIYGFRKEVE